MTQPDTIIPGAGNPQAWDRYAYTFNNPLKYTDPSGHDPWASDPDFYYSETSVNAGIYQQSRCYCGWKQEAAIRAVIGPSVSVLINYPNYYTSLGAAKVSHAQMNEDYGVIVKMPNSPTGEGERGIGLGLLGLDPNNFDIAKKAMGRRISSSLQACAKAGCSETDKIIVAALAANGDIFPGDIRSAFKNKLYFASNGTFDWNKFINDENVYSPRQKDYIKEHTIPDFLRGWNRLDYKKAYPEVKWDYIEGLSQ